MIHTFLTVDDLYQMRMRVKHSIRFDAHDLKTVPGLWDQYNELLYKLAKDNARLMAEVQVLKFKLDEREGLQP